MSTLEAAEFYGMPPNSIRRFVHEGKIKPSNPNSRFKFRKIDFEEFFERNKLKKAWRAG